MHQLRGLFDHNGKATLLRLDQHAERPGDFETGEPGYAPTHCFVNTDQRDFQVKRGGDHCGFAAIKGVG